MKINNEPVEAKRFYWFLHFRQPVSRICNEKSPAAVFYHRDYCSGREQER